jgi:hypothetical protein
MSRRLQPTLADYLVIAVSPVLIMTLVGSLVFFLLEVFYQGNYQARLQFILAMFVMAAVLIGRISIASGTDRAATFALPLAVVTGLAIHRFVENATIFNWFLLGLIWWATHRLTWDCTFLEESEDVSNEGLLQTIRAGRDRDCRANNPAHRTGDPEEVPDGVTSREDRQRKVSWWEGWIDRRARPNAPGVWIVYFSLAALPVFGIGQGLIPAENVASRQYVFWLLCVYVASGLGLLMNTSLLGLRRYLRQRLLQMPGAMAGVWLLVGSVLCLGLLVLALFLPRPNAGDPLSLLMTRLESPDHQPSRYAVGEEGVRRDDAEEGGSHKQKAEEGDRGQGEAPDEKKGEGKQGDQDSSQGQEGEKAGQSQSEDSRRQGKSGDQDSTKPEPRENAQSTQDGKGQEQEHESAERMSKPPSSLPELSFSSFFQWLGPALRWLIYGVVFLVAGYWLWRARTQVVAVFHELLKAWREFWDRLFGRRVPEAGPLAVEEIQSEPLRPLSAFADPFLTGDVARMTPGELVRYTFAALEAWGRENNCARQPEETPHEFAHKVGERATSLSREVWVLADLYCRVAYAPGQLSAVTARPIEQLWRVLLDASRPSHTTS